MGDAGRALLEREVRERAEHRTAEQVRTTASFARAERLLGGEYHGRFLIELLQNAADAWRNDERSADGAGSRVHVLISPGPALVVANQGVPLTPEVVIESLGHIGASTKSEGESIGHKGIGFKSVLELTSRPEVYSGLQNPEPTLAVRFDPERALTLIEESSERWKEYVGRTRALDVHDPFDAIPVLRYPAWVDTLPDDVKALASEGYDTVVRLPFDQRLADRRGMSKDSWELDVRRAVHDDLSDQILLLLGAFEEVMVEDLLDGAGPVTIRPEAFGVAPQVPDADGELVRIVRSNAPTTHWRLYRRVMRGEQDLAGEIAVGLRYEVTDSTARVVPALHQSTSAPFHLFFPTQIPSGLPFLLHGYFQVDASRKGFHGAAEASNLRILHGLARLVTDVVVETSQDTQVDAASLVNLVADCPEPEDRLAHAFRTEVLALLDHEPWIPAQSADGAPELAEPKAFFVGGPRLTRLIADVFSPSYVRRRTELALSHPDLSDAAIELIGRRQTDDRDMWDVLGALFRPGDVDVWAASEADARFRELFILVNWLVGEWPYKGKHFLEGLQGDPTSRLLPVVSDGGGRELLHLPEPGVGSAGSRSQLVMARVRSSGDSEVVPPRALEVSFLPDGLLRNEQETGQARLLGIRPFTVDNVLDRLNGVAGIPEHAQDVLTFVWRFLARERRNQYGTRKVAERSAVFNPAEWFWCRPGRARESDARRLEQQRERYLAGVLLPARDGTWHPAGELAFGADWAGWAESHHTGLPRSVVETRAVAYRALEAVCPDPESLLLAPPDDVLGLLEVVDVSQVAELDGIERLDDAETGDGAAEVLDDDAWDRERHAFLLRLGVWEVLPVEGFEGRDLRGGRDRFPWNGPEAQLQRLHTMEDGRWAFGLDGWRGTGHSNVYLAEDFRFRWSLGSAASRSSEGTAHLLQLGLPLYEGLLNATVFCPGCSDPAGSYHVAQRQSSSADGYPSCLAIQLQRDPWVPALQGGVPVEGPSEPSRVWWLERPPAGLGITTSAWRFVSVTGPSTGVTDDLRRIAHVVTLDTAGAPELRTLLTEMKSRFDAGEIDLSKSVDRRSFTSLHAMIYERLADLGADEARAVVADVGVLCNQGHRLVFAPAPEARHDDGSFSSYVRYFLDRVPLVVVPRERPRTADRLGVAGLTIELSRDDTDTGSDVTDELTGLLAERVPELLAILVHHSLGSQTLTIDSDAFRQRAQRLRRLTVRKVDDLVIRASVEGFDEHISLGARTTGDLFLEPATSSKPPVLFHDFDGDGWQDRLRRKIAPHLAAVLEANAYAHTFALFLQAEGDGEREEFLLELGITDEDVAVVASQLGAVGETERASSRRWYSAVLRTLGVDRIPELHDRESVGRALRDAGADGDLVQRLLAAGGGEEARTSTAADSAIRALHAAGIDLTRVDDALRALSPDDGLRIQDARRLLHGWKRQHERRVVAVRARAVDVARAKAEVRELEVPPSLSCTLDVSLPQVLAGVADLIAPGRPEVAEQLARDPVPTLTRLGEFATANDLDVAAGTLYDAEEQRRALAARAHRWRTQIRRLAVLVGMTDAETRGTIRAHDEAVGKVLGFDLLRPSALIGPVEELFVSHPVLRDRVLGELDDAVLGPEPDESSITRWAREAGVTDAMLTKYDATLREPSNRHAARLRARTGRLAEAKVTATIPAGLVAPTAHPSAPLQPAGQDRDAPIKVRKIKVDASIDQRKRELGDEGEQWALADVVGTFLAMTDDDRAAAVDDVRSLLERFDSEVTKNLLEHAAPAAAPRQDDEDDDLVAALVGLLHASKLSDGFGFDLIGWASPAPGLPPHATCLEVKSTTGGSFHLSSNEWRVAKALTELGAANRYAVLAVRRAKSGEVPAGMDLLVDPVRLEEAGLLTLDTDGYVVRYAVSP